MYRLENGVEWTEGLKTAFKQNVKRAKVICGNIEINEENNLSNLVIEEQRYISDYGFVGTATARKLELNFLDSAGNINLENQELTVKIGAEYNGQTYYINYGNFMVDKAPERDETSGKVRVVAYDYMKRFDKPYESSVTYPCTLLQELQDVCNQANVVLATTDFANNDFIVEDNQFEGYTLRQVLQNIGKCAFSWARIGQDNKLYLDFSLVADNTETITIDDYYYNKFKKAMEYYGPVNQVTYADSDIEGQEEMVKDQASIDENGLKELVIYNNLFAYTVTKRIALIQAGTRLFGLRYMPIKQLDMKGLIYLDSRDVINIETSDEQTFTSRVFNHIIEYNGSTTDSVVTEGTSNNEEAYKNTATNIYQDEQTSIKLDKAAKKIESVVEEVNEQNNKISQVTQTVDDLNAKISDIADITEAQETITGKLNFTDVNESEPITIRIKPIGVNISYLYPRSNLYPSSTLFMTDRKLRFTNLIEYQITNDTKYKNYKRYYSYDGLEYTLLVLGVDYDVGDSIVGIIYENKYVDYILPTDLLWYDSNNYDEFLLDYDSQTCQVRKKVTYNADGTTALLPAETTYTFEYPHTNLDDGNYEIELLGYSNAYLYVRLMKTNIYTTQFATRSEMYSLIDATAGQLTLEVQQKLDKGDFSGASIILAINNDNTGSIKINGDKIDIDGKAVHFKTNITEKKGPYSQYDTDRIVNIMSGSITPTQDDYDRYDIDEDRKITTVDLFMIVSAIANNNGFIEKSGTFEINPNTIKKSVAIWNNELNDYSSSLSLYGSYFNTVSTKNLKLIKENSEYDSDIDAEVIRLENEIGRFILHTKTKSNNIDCQVLSMINKIGNTIQSEAYIYTYADGNSKMLLSGNGTSTEVSNTGIITPTVTQTSKEEDKKNFEKLKNALDIIKDIDIYKYNLKTENDNTKQHLGFVIGDNFKYRKEVTSTNNDGVDTYSFVSLCCKAIQEQQILIEELQNEINKLKEGK